MNAQTPPMSWDALWAVAVWPIVAALVATALGMVAIFRDRLFGWARTTTFGRSTEAGARLDLRIQDVLTQLRVEMKARRAYLSKFHNGDVYADGSHVQKKSRTHESVDWGVSYQSELFFNRLTSTVPEELKLIHEPGPGFRFVADLPTGLFRWLCEQGGTHAIARFAIHKGKDVIGFVGLDFGPEVTAEPPNLYRLADYVRRIENELSTATE